MPPPNKRLKLAGGDRFEGSGVLCPWRGTDFVQQPCAGARRILNDYSFFRGLRLKRDPLDSRLKSKGARPPCDGQGRLQPCAAPFRPTNYRSLNPGSATPTLAHLLTVER